MSIFARDITDDLASLVKQIDEQVAKNKDEQLSAFFVLLTDDPDAAAPKLEELAKNKKIEHVPLTIYDGEAGPGDYEIAEEANVTILIWEGLTVKANHAFKKGELNAEKAKKVLADTSKILE